MHSVIDSHDTEMNGNTAPTNSHKPTKLTKSRHSLPATTLSYPSQSLRFLEKLQDDPPLHSQARSDAIDLEPARLKLHVIIVGAGLGGLALAIALARRGHTVRVLEQAPQLGEVG